MSDHIVICGHGATGAHVARVLSEHHRVTVIDRSRERLPEPRPGLDAIAGDATDPKVLIAAGAREADAVIAITGDDAANALIATLAKRRLGVRSVVARVDDASHAWLFGPDAGVDAVVSAADLVARLVQEEVGAGDLVTLLRLRGAGIAVTETTIPAGAAVAGLTVEELELPAGVALTAVVREGEVLLADRAGRLTAGDVVVALCEPGREPALYRLLAGGAGAP
jgi:trk system potassium uptake protein TrkA